MALSDKSVEFLLADLHASVSQWQHMDDRMDREIQYYVTLFGVIVTAIGLLIQFGTNILVTAGVAHLLAVVICVAGVRLIRRIIHLTGQGALYSAQVSLIRSAFIDTENRVASYVILTTASKDKTAHYFTPISKQLAIRILAIFNSILITGVVFSITVYFYYFYQIAISPITWKWIFTINSLISVSIGCLAYWYQKRISILGGDEYLDHVTKSVQQKRQGNGYCKRQKRAPD